jgi:DNA-binding response OmpR family regulator
MSVVSVLIIEDDKWLAEQYKRALTSSEYKVTIANHALSAIQLIDAVKPDVMILDVLLTGSTAFTLLHELQSYSDTGLIPIILCTNLANDLSLHDLSSYGVKKIIDKSKMLPSDLEAGIRSVL